MQLHCDFTWNLDSIEDTTPLEALHVQFVTESTCTYCDIHIINSR